MQSMVEANNNLKDIIEIIDSQREAKGFLTIEEVLALNKKGNLILDPFSILISKRVKIGSQNIFYPSIIVEILNNGAISIDNGNTFFPQTSMLADNGEIIIGNNNQFGDGGVSIKANQPGVKIRIGNEGRYLNGVQVIGNTSLGSGSQLIGGLLTVQDCSIENGLPYTHPEPDERGGVIKGFGVARNLTIKQGQVINGSGVFLEEDIKKQSFYHPKK